MQGKIRYECVAKVIKDMVEPEGIEVQLVEESVSQSSSAVPFAPVQIFVARTQALQARERLTPFAAVIEPEQDDEPQDPLRGHG